MNLHDNLRHAGGSVVSILGVIGANHATFDWYYRQLATTVAIVAGLCTVWSIFFRKKAD